MGNTIAAKRCAGLAANGWRRFDVGLGAYADRPRDGRAFPSGCAIVREVDGDGRSAGGFESECCRIVVDALRDAEVQSKAFFVGLMLALRCWLGRSAAPVGRVALRRTSRPLPAVMFHRLGTRSRGYANLEHLLIILRAFLTPELGRHSGRAPSAHLASTCGSSPAARRSRLLSSFRSCCAESDWCCCYARASALAKALVPAPMPKLTLDPQRLRQSTRPIIRMNDSARPTNRDAAQVVYYCSDGHAHATSRRADQRCLAQGRQFSGRVYEPDNR